MVTLLLLGAVMGTAAHLVPVPLVLPGSRLLCAGLAAAGALVAAAGVVSLRRAGTTVNPMRPENASRLVTGGIYRRTRNPIYLGMLLVLLGFGVWLGDALALVLAAAFVPLMNGLQIRPEERALDARFGAEFAAYRTAVRRWL